MSLVRCITLFDFSRNTEKVVYYLLLRRKKRHPSFHDDADSLPYKHPGGLLHSLLLLNPVLLRQRALKDCLHFLLDTVRFYPLNLY